MTKFTSGCPLRKSSNLLTGKQRTLNPELAEPDDLAVEAEVEHMLQSVRKSVWV